LGRKEGGGGEYRSGGMTPQTSGERSKGKKKTKREKKKGVKTKKKVWKE